MRADAVRNRTRILDAARELVAEQGAEVSMDAVAARAGVAVGTLYRHHPTKADLIEAAVADSIDRMAELCENAVDAVDAGADAAAELAGLFAAVAERFAADRALKSASSLLGAPVSHDLADFPPGSAPHRAARAIEALLGTAQAEGTIRPGITAADLIMLLGGVPDGPATVRRRYLDIVLAGIAAPLTGSPP